MVDNNQITKLILESQDGFETSFNELYQQTSDILVNQVKEILKDEQMSYDIVHDTYLKVLQTKMKNTDNGLSYLITIARNLAINAYNRRKKEVLLPFEEFESIYKLDSYKRNEPHIEELMNKCLSTYQIDLIKKHVLEGFTHVEIAEKLAKPVGTIMWQYNEAIKALRNYLNKESRNI